MTKAKTTTGIEEAIEQATEAVAVQARTFEPLAPDASAGEPIGLDNLLAVPVRVTVEIGRTRITLAELIGLGAGSLLPLDRDAHEPVDILVGDKIVARGEVVTIDEKYGVRVTSV